MTLQRMSHAGAAPLTGVAVGFNATAMSFTILSGTGYPTGSVGPFVLKIDAGTASEEKILCSSLSGTTVTVAGSGRGYDGTSATTHGTGTTNVEHDFAAIEADDANDHIYTTTRDDHTQYARTDGTRSFTGGVTVASGNLTLSTGSLSVQGNATVQGAETVAGSVTALSFISSAVWTNVSSFTNGYTSVITPRYILYGSEVHVQGAVTGGTPNTSAFTLPVGYRPSEQLTFAVAGNNAFCQLEITTAGLVIPITTGTSVNLNVTFSVT